jgi:predicted transporter
MFDMNVEAKWVAVRTAVFFVGAYLAWLTAFERWFEPMLRRWTSSIARRSVVWVPAGYGLRIWGLQDVADAAADAAEALKDAGVAFVGALFILASALVPAVALTQVAAARTDDPRISATGYLICVPLMALFVFRMLSTRSDRT